jgi:hypothetical protein
MKSLSVLGSIVAGAPQVLNLLGITHISADMAKALLVIGGAIFGIGQRKQQQNALEVQKQIAKPATSGGGTGN